MSCSCTSSLAYGRRNWVGTLTTIGSHCLAIVVVVLVDHDYVTIVQLSVILATVLHVASDLTTISVTNSFLLFRNGRLSEA